MELFNPKSNACSRLPDFGFSRNDHSKLYEHAKFPHQSKKHEKQSV